MDITTTMICEVGSGSIGNTAAAALARIILDYARNNPDLLKNRKEEQHEQSDTHGQHR